MITVKMGATTLSIMTFSKMALSMTIKIVTLSTTRLVTVILSDVLLTVAYAECSK